MAVLLQLVAGMTAPLYLVVLAAGAGTRLARVTGGVPKQFWSIDGGRSLVEETVERFRGLVPVERTFTVIDQAHQHYVRGLVGRGALGQLLAQPCNRGTATGILLALADIRESAPDAIVLVTPSDHGIAGPRLFRQGVSEAVAAVRKGRAGIVLFGAEPDSAHADYGWIAPRSRRGENDRIQGVATFVEKPGPAEAARLLTAGAVWNTMVLVARADALFDLYRRFVPEMVEDFAQLSRVPVDRRQAYLAELYPRLPSTDFSSDVLSRAKGLAVYTWPASAGWSDLGTPERLALWLRRDGTPTVTRATCAAGSVDSQVA
jgi:mannose-1-phosphate guanylyltransferase